MKNTEKNTKLKRGACITLAVVTVMTTIVALACTTNALAMSQKTQVEVPVETVAPAESENLQTIEDFNIIFEDCGKINEKGEIIFDFSDVEVMRNVSEENISDFENYREGSLPVTLECLDSEIDLDLDCLFKEFDEDDIEKPFTDGFTLNDDGSVTINFENITTEDDFDDVYFDSYEFDEDYDNGSFINYTISVNNGMFIDPLDPLDIL